MVWIEIRIEVTPRKRAELLQALEDLAPIRLGPTACLSHEMYEDVDQPNRFLWVERWQDNAHVDRRMTSEPFMTLMGAVRVLAPESHLDVVQTAIARQ